MGPEQKIPTLMKSAVQKVTKSRNLFVNACAGTLSVAKNCVLLRKHKRFVGYEVDLSRVTATIQLPILLHA